MSVAVYPRPGELLRARDLTVAELGRQITLRFGLDVDSQSLDAWVRDPRVQRADLELAGAAAAVLDVSIADLFEVDLTPALPDGGTVLDERDAERLAELLDLQQAGAGSKTDEAEIQSLLAEYSRRVQEIGLRTTAEQRGISVDEARHELDADLEEARRWWSSFQSDPKRRRAAVTELKRKSRRVASRT